MFKIRFILFVALIFCSAGLSAQITTDYGFRIGGSFKQNLNKDFGFSVEQELRFSENASMLDKSNTTFSVGYEVKKWLEFGVNYLFILGRRGSSKGVWITTSNDGSCSFQDKI